MTTIRLTYPSPHTLLLVMRTLKIYSLSNFQMYNAVLLTTVTMLYIASLGLTALDLLPLDHLHPFPLPVSSPCLATANLSSVSGFSVFTFLHVSEITHCLSFPLLVVSALLRRVLAGCPTNFWNSLLPSHCPS